MTGESIQRASFEEIDEYRYYNEQRERTMPEDAKLFDVYRMRMMNATEGSLGNAYALEFPVCITNIDESPNKSMTVSLKDNDGLLFVDLTMNFNDRGFIIPNPLLERVTGPPEVGYLAGVIDTYDQALEELVTHSKSLVL